MNTVELFFEGTQMGTSCVKSEQVYTEVHNEDWVLL